MKILLAEDEKDIATFVKKGLESELFTVDVAENGSQGERMARANAYDIVILDHNLPEKNGIDICDTLRKNGKNMPIVMLTAEKEVAKKVQAFQCGANDYMTKPFAIEELIARIHVLLRDHPHSSGTVLTHRDLEIDLDKFIAKRSEKSLDLRKKELALLEYFMRNIGAILTRSMILEHVWDTNADPFTNTVEVHVRRLRQKLNAEDTEHYIETIRGIGYRLN
ncbi:MAG: response regulator transcription factor [Parcubacteria group bacterium]|jgi:DNA-binding response OmpR family regulator